MKDYGFDLSSTAVEPEPTSSKPSAPTSKEAEKPEPRVSKNPPIARDDSSLPPRRHLRSLENRIFMTRLRRSLKPMVNGFADDIRLLPHQFVARSWMKDVEEGDRHGGILADDMGYVPISISYRFDGSSPSLALGRPFKLWRVLLMIALKYLRRTQRVTVQPRCKKKFLILQQPLIA